MRTEYALYTIHKSRVNVLGIKCAKNSPKATDRPRTHDRYLHHLTVNKMYLEGKLTSIRLRRFLINVNVPKGNTLFVLCSRYTYDSFNDVQWIQSLLLKDFASLSSSRLLWN